MAKATFVGFDIETHDDDAHDGIKTFRKNDTARVFDINRTTLCGFSLYFDGDDVRYYFNIAHADICNRLDWLTVKPLLEAKPKSATFICHNAPFELTMMRKCVGFELGNCDNPNEVICTMQMAVSAYGPDEYDLAKFTQAGLHDLEHLMPDINNAFVGFAGGNELTSEQSELLSKFIAKESEAAHSYNGFVDKIAYGYSLKRAVWSHFEYKMTTFEECLRGRDHMGQLTGQEVAGYGSDDAYWTVRLFHYLLGYMSRINPSAIDAFFTQENPMIYVYSDLWSAGLRINTQAVSDRRGVERHICAELLREMKTLVKSFTWPIYPNQKLAERDEWYAKNWAIYRNRINEWAKSPDFPDDFKQCKQISGSVPMAWVKEIENPNVKKLPGPNFTHYMMMRTLIYDLLDEKPIVMMGKTQSDGESRGFLQQRFDKRIREAKDRIALLAPGAANSGGQDFDAIEEIRHWESEIATYERKKKLLFCISALAGIEQRMKLYLNPYMLLKDPQSGRMYPTINSLLATRRLGGKNPNPMQLSKQGDSTYIRGFFLPDHDDHVIVSIDWKQIELVLIGDFSGDPGFAKAYGQLPYDDLHLGAAADILSAIYNVEVTEEMFKSLKSMPDDVEAPFGFPLVDGTGKRLTPKEAYKYNRGTDGGKGANFGYWYSGSLNSVATKRGVGQETMWRMTEIYRNRFPVAELWRVGLIAEANENGFVRLPDGHTRVRYESTQGWAYMMQQKFDAYGSEAISEYGKLAIRRIQKRSGNQIVNSMIQGSCATLAKRSIQGINREIKGAGFDARFMMPIHDELVYSVHRREVWDFLTHAKKVMVTHPDIIKTLKIDCSAAVGRTFEPYHSSKAGWGQIEIDEAPKLACLDPKLEGKQLDRDQTEAVVDWLFREAA